MTSIAYLVGMCWALIAIGACTKCARKLEQCESRKGSKRQVCGTDNRTYVDRCALVKAQCTANSDVTVKHKGPCKAKRACWTDLGSKYAAAKRSSSSTGEYQPQCLADGTYAPVQCAITNGLSYCWCVMPNGRIVPDTTVHSTKPQCPERGRKGSAEMSPLNGKSRKKECNPADKKQFLHKLQRIFKTEYIRDSRTHDGEDSWSWGSRKVASEVNAAAIIWKFRSLDEDGNGTLVKAEFKQLRRWIRRVVKPRRCAHSFVRMCDNNPNDLLISQQEWVACLSPNITVTPKISTNSGIGTDADDVDEGSEKDDGQDDEESINSTLLLGNGLHILNEYSRLQNEEAESKEPEIVDCPTDRKQKLDNQDALYIPECTEKGKYQKIQCYKPKAYCWCVLEETGKQIPGTVVKDVQPKCDDIQIPPAPIKGCPNERKLVFIKDFMEHFRNNISSTASTEEYADKNAMYDFLAASSFDYFDANKNKVLEKHEWKAFRMMVSEHAHLKQCGRKLPRHCDANRDFKITLTEWLNCLSIQKLGATVRSTPIASRRRGPNPLESYLKD